MEEVPTRADSSMKTIDKALRLLDFFTTENPEFRLSDLSRAAGVDKATALRILNSLAKGGFIEQSPETKRYRLGTAVLRLARIRETCFPIVSVLQPILDRLATTTGESAHAGLASDAGLTTIALSEPNRATRVWINPAQVLPFHATASGLVFLAFSSPDFAKQWLNRGEVRRFTNETLVAPEDLSAYLSEIRARGLAFSAGTLEPDVAGIAAPILDWNRRAIATVAVACVRSRLTETLRAQIETQVAAAAAEAARSLGR